MSGWRPFAASLALWAVAGPVAAQQQARIQMNLTPAGQAVVKRYLASPDPRAVVLNKRGAELGAQLKALVAAPKLDLGRFGVLLRQQEQLQGQAMRIGNDRMLRLLGELGEADRIAFLRGMANPVRVPAPAPAPAPARK